MTDFSAKSSFHCTNKTKTARSHWAKTIPLDRVIQRVLSSSFLLWLKLFFQNWPATTTAPSPTCVPWRDRNSINGERELCRKWVWPNRPELVWGHWVRICRPAETSDAPSHDGSWWRLRPPLWDGRGQQPAPNCHLRKLCNHGGQLRTPQGHAGATGPWPGNNKVI